MIKNSVGRGGKNNLNDGMIVQNLLNKASIPNSDQLVADGMVGVRTIVKIEAFQRLIGVSKSMGLILPDSVTMTELMRRTETSSTVHTQIELTDPAPSNTAQGAPWIDTATPEIGQKEVSGAASNPRIMEYHKAAKYWAKDDTGGVNAWCGSFVSWVMAQHGFTLPANSFRAKEWKNFGTKLKSPVYGAIGIKTRTGGGHVAFIVGQSRDGKYYYMLGGNQSNAVNISRYPAAAWDDFVFPPNVTPGDTLPVYQGASSDAGGEA